MALRRRLAIAAVGCRYYNTGVVMRFSPHAAMELRHYVADAAITP